MFEKKNVVQLAVRLGITGKRKKNKNLNSSFSKRPAASRKVVTYVKRNEPKFVLQSNPPCWKDRFLTIVQLPSGQRLSAKCHLTCASSDLLRWTLNRIELPARLAFLFGLALERPPIEHHFLDDDFLLVDALTTGCPLDLRLRFKFCPKSCLNSLPSTITKNELIQLAYGQLRNDLSRGHVHVDGTKIDALGALVGAALQADRGDRIETDRIHLEEYLSGELVDWLALVYKRSELEHLARNAWAAMKCKSQRDAQLIFVEKCPPIVSAHSVFLDEADIGSYALLTVNGKGLELYRRKFDEDKFWQMKRLLVLQFDSIEKVTSSSRCFTAFCSMGVKYRFYCKGNAIK